MQKLRKFGKIRFSYGGGPGLHFQGFYKVLTIPSGPGMCDSGLAAPPLRCGVGGGFLCSNAEKRRISSEIVVARGGDTVLGAGGASLQP